MNRGIYWVYIEMLRYKVRLIIQDGDEKSAATDSEVWHVEVSSYPQDFYYSRYGVYG